MTYTLNETFKHFEGILGKQAPDKSPLENKPYTQKPTIL